jgi:hypothetical protein
MDVNAIYVKTEKGEEEIRSRAYKLSQRLRTILIMVDGTTTGGGWRKRRRLLACRTISWSICWKAALLHLRQRVTGTKRRGRCGNSCGSDGR